MKRAGAMKYFQMLFPASPGLYILLAILGIFNSLWATFLIIMLNRSVSVESGADNYKNLAIYSGLFISSLFISKYFQTLMIRITSQSSYEFQSKIFEDLRYASFREFELLGQERIYTALGDARLIGTFPGYFVEVFNAFTYVVCGLAYIFYASFISGIVMVVLMVLLGLRYFMVQGKIEHQLLSMRKLEDSYYRYIMDFLYGFSQFKMNSTRNDSFFKDFLARNRSTALELNSRVMSMELNNNLIGYYSWYFIIGIVAFVVPVYFDVSKENQAGYVMAILFIMTPLVMMVKLLPSYTKIRFSLERLDHFMKDVGKLEKGGESERKTHVTFEHLEFRNIQFSYLPTDNDSFRVGPINFGVAKGSVVFITGSNGSGKSTFIKLLTGLYRPSAGSIYLNGTKVDEQNVEQFRNTFSCVFADHCLFRENYDKIDFSETNKQLAEYIALLKLDEVCPDIRKLLQMRLSKGQEKRCALVYALMESRDVLMLDEWAADQDPEFRNYFYTVLIPVIRSLGKTVIAVTHDDRYFDCADRILRFSDGQIMEITGEMQVKVTGVNES